jgi:hypothetical protein
MLLILFFFTEGLFACFLITIMKLKRKFEKLAEEITQDISQIGN